MDENLSAVSADFDPAAHPKADSDYNQHNVDVDASGEAEDRFAAMLAGILGEPMTAAGDPDWDPKEHPRGPDGKFIENGFGFSGLKIVEKITPKNVKVGDVIKHPNDYYQSEPKKVKSIVSPNTNSKSGIGFQGYTFYFDDDTSISLTKSAHVDKYAEPSTSSDSAAEIAAHLKKKIAEASIAKNIAYMNGDDYEAQTFKEVQEKLEKQLKDFEASPKPPPLPPAAKPVAKVTGGKPITAWTKTIYSGDYKDGDVVAVKKDATERLVWDALAKKFMWQTKSPHKASSGWLHKEQLTKKGAYEKFKGEKTDWLTPAAGAALVDSAPPPNMGPSPVEAAIISGDFSALKKVGQQAGSTPGGFFEAPDGSRWYVKAQHSQAHANNEALASALYRAAGVDLPEVIRGKGAPGLSGQTQTATRIIEGAQPNLKQKLEDPAYIAKIREGFAVDAWLANWDAVGLVFDNVVEGPDGEPHRIDVGGSLIFRAMGDPKGAAFGPTVGELDTLRTPQTAPTASKVFGGITDEQLSASAAKVDAVSSDQIRQLVKDYDMDPSVADILIARRLDLLSKVPVKTVVKGSSPEFTILPKDQRGKSGDAHFAPKIWGKYGAAGVMMRHVDDDGIARFLLVKANTTNSKRWQLPGGALEELETPEQGAAREVHEELGFTQDFLHNMTPIGTHKITIDVPDKGKWSYSNIAVDVPSQPNLKWDESELGGAQWFTAEQLAVMSADDEIHPALAANLNQVLGKFTKPSSAAPEPAPIINPSSIAPTISQQNIGSSTTWTKKKFTQATAYKTSYADGEIVGIAKFGSVLGGGDSTRIVWSDGKFHQFIYDGKFWQYSGSWASKKKALDELKDKTFYVPPKGTMVATNNDFIPGTSLISGNATIVKTAVTPDVNAVSTPTLLADQPSKAVKLIPFQGGAFWPNIESLMVHINGVHTGAVHQKENGKWKISVSGGKNNYLVYDTEYDSKEQAAKALEDAHNAYVAAGSPGLTPAAAPISAPAKASATKKTPKLTVAQIEKQNGVVPKTLTHAKKAVFLKDLKEDSPVGFVKSGEENTQKVFIALVHAVNKHNETNSPKLNYLQGANLLDQTYGSKQKESLVKWLRTAEGKAQAPGIISGAVTKVPGKVSGSNFNSKTGNVTVVRVNSNLATVSSPYEIGTPKKIAPDDFQHFSLSDATAMHLEMDKKRPLTVAQQKVVEKYTQSAFPFNQPLRGTGDNASFWDPQAIADLQSAMRPVTQSFTVTRMTAGLGSVITSSTSEADIKKLQGAVISDPAFLSTSIPGGTFSSDRFKLVINIPEGTPAVWAYHYGADTFEQEREMLLAAGLHYRIDKIDPPTGSGYERKIYLTVVPEMKVK